MYNDRVYAQGRLINTIIRTNKQRPVVVKKIPIVGECVVEDLKSGRMSSIEYESLDMSPVPLGFMNYDGEGIFAARKPMRRDWRQGLRSHNIMLYNKRIGMLNLTDDMSKALADTIMNKYPTLEFCVDKIKNGYGSLAFCRGFSVAKGGILYYKGEFEVGKVENYKPVLHPKYVYLDRVLNEGLNNGR